MYKEQTAQHATYTGVAISLQSPDTASQLSVDCNEVENAGNTVPVMVAQSRSCDDRTAQRRTQPRHVQTHTVHYYCTLIIQPSVALSETWLWLASGYMHGYLDQTDI